MRKEDDLAIDQPALILSYGSSTRRCRPLDKDVIVIGRAPGCDLGLVSPEVASVHCVIVRVAGGWRVRDCSGRLGTRVNGKSVQDEPLRDGDSVQVGTFSFEARLPATGPSSPTPRPARGPGPLTALPLEMAAELNRLRRSRLGFAKRALALRRRLREECEREDRLERREAEVDQKDGNLQKLQHELDQRLRALQQTRQELDTACLRMEQDRTGLETARRLYEESRKRLDIEWTSLEKNRQQLEAGRAALARECKLLEETRRQSEQEHVKGRAEVKARIDPCVQIVDEAGLKAQEELERRRQQLEKAHEEVNEFRHRLEVERQTVSDARESARGLDLRAGELASFARHLQRLRERTITGPVDNEAGDMHR